MGNDCLAWPATYVIHGPGREGETWPKFSDWSKAWFIGKSDWSKPWLACDVIHGREREKGESASSVFPILWSNSVVERRKSDWSKTLGWGTCDVIINGREREKVFFFSFISPIGHRWWYHGLQEKGDWSNTYGWPVMSQSTVLRESKGGSLDFFFVGF